LLCGEIVWDDRAAKVGGRFHFANIAGWPDAVISEDESNLQTKSRG
jgi:hypothetical protein